MAECINALCDYADEHEHGWDCTEECPCGEGGHDAEGNEL